MTPEIKSVKQEEAGEQEFNVKIEQSSQSDVSSFKSATLKKLKIPKIETAKNSIHPEDCYFKLGGMPSFVTANMKNIQSNLICDRCNLQILNFRPNIRTSTRGSNP